MTIYALSSGPGISGIAVVRVSGKDTAKVVKKLTGKELPSPRVATLKKFNKIDTNELIDEGVIIWFPGPNSYTGEDLAEFHVHGSRAVISALHSSISKINNCRLAEPGEFTKIAFQNGKINLLELFHGPTLAFKDIAMQVIGNMYEKILKKNNLKINVVVATSGDTGAAAINAIRDRKNMKIFVLHPDNKISEVQRKFMTTVNSDNVFNIALASNFDECQKFVKSMFADKDFSKSINMSGVNSINWSRIVVQIVYYFFSYFKVAKESEKINFSVPTGNFGDIYAGYVA